MSHHDKELRDRINAQAGLAGKIAKEALGIDWYDTESQARRVAEHAAEMSEKSDQYIAELRHALKEAREFICYSPDGAGLSSKVLRGIENVLGKSKRDSKGGGITDTQIVDTLSKYVVTASYPDTRLPVYVAGYGELRTSFHLLSTFTKGSESEETQPGE